MTAIVRAVQPPTDYPGLLRRTVTGTPAEVNATIERVRSRGHLVAEGLPVQVHGDRHRVRVTLTLSPVPIRAATPTRPSLARRAVKPLVIAAGILAALTGLGFGLFYLVQQTVRAAAAGVPAALGFVVVVLVLIALARRKTGGCSGLHCGGCGGH